MKKLLAIALFLTIVALSPASMAHSGGTDSLGCHYDHRTGIRHCH